MADTRELKLATDKATEADYGVAKLGADGSTTAGLVVQASDSRMTDSRDPTSHTHPHTDVTDWNEGVDDRVAALLVAGSGITATYDDTANTLTITSTVPNESIDDRVAALLVAGSNITLTYNDGSDTLTIASTSSVTSEQIDDRVAALLIAGAAVILTYDDGAGTLTVDVDIGTGAGQAAAGNHTHTGLTPAAHASTHISTGTDAIAGAVASGASGLLIGSDKAKLDGLTLGSTVQAWDADLDAIAALTPTNDDVIQRKSGAWTNRTMAQVKTDLVLVKGDVGLGNVDNTSDATKNAAAVTLTNKTLTTPTIGSFTNATHDHTNAAGGGTLAAAAPAAHKATHEVGGSDPFTGIVPGSAFVPSGLTGAVSASRYVGATASVAPTTGTFAVGDFVITQTGKIYVCTTLGSPGTWTQVGAIPTGVMATDTLWAAAGDIAVATGNDAAGILSIGTAYQRLRVNSGATALEYFTDYAWFDFIIDGGGAVITTGNKGTMVLPAGVLVEARLANGDGLTGSIVVDLWKDTYANHPPTVADTITASAKPTISSGIKSQDTTLTGWTTTLADGDHLNINVDSVTTFQRVTLALKIRKT